MNNDTDVPKFENTPEVPVNPIPEEATTTVQNTQAIPKVEDKPVLEPQKKGMSKTTTIILIILLLVAAAAIGFFAGRWLFDLVNNK